MRENDVILLLNILSPYGLVKGPWIVVQLGLMPRKYSVKETLLLRIQNKGKEQIQKDIPRQKVSNRHLSCFSFSATLNNIAVKMVVHIFFQVSVFSLQKNTQK